MTPLLDIRGLSKRFGPVHALDSVSLKFEPGRIYGLAGENGAGKSTFVKILCGVHPPDGGEMFWAGRPFQPRNPAEAEAAGISVFHQEIPICPNLSVAANLFLGPRMPKRGILPDWKNMEARCHELFTEWLGIDLEPQRLMGDCTVAERQLALLARVLSRQARLIILDEPTTALSAGEVARLFKVIRRLQAQGITFVFVSHLLDELIELCEEIYVLRDGTLAGHLQRAVFDVAQLARLIAGRTVSDSPHSTDATKSAARLEVRGLTRDGEFSDVSFTVRGGEVLAITGLEGSGRSAVARALFAAPPADRGEIILNGVSQKLSTPRHAIKAGLGYVPEDRKTLGLFDDLDIQRNLGLVSLRSLTRRGFLRRTALRELTLRMQRDLQIKMDQPTSAITSLSGGNQQKVLIARWLALKPQVLIMNEPTRGVDIGAKDEICKLIRRLADEGCSFVIASSDLDDVLRVADRIAVMNRGRWAALLPRGAATKEQLIEAASVAPIEALSA